MPSGGGNLQGALHLLLSFHLRHVGAVEGGGGGDPGRGGGDGLLAGEVALQLLHVSDGVDDRPLGQGSFGGVFLGNIQGGDALPLGGQGHGQHPGTGTQPARQGQLPHKGAVFPGQAQLLTGGQDAHQHGQVVEGAHFF